jgi:hypothetical protein
MIDGNSLCGSIMKHQQIFVDRCSSESTIEILRERTVLDIPDSANCIQVESILLNLCLGLMSLMVDSFSFLTTSISYTTFSSTLGPSAMSHYEDGPQSLNLVFICQTSDVLGTSKLLGQDCLSRILFNSLVYKTTFGDQP